MIRSAGRLALLAGSLAALTVACGGDGERSDAELRDVRLAAVIKGLDNPWRRSWKGLAAADPGCYVVNPINSSNLVGALARVADDAPIVNIDSVIGKDAASAVGVDITAYIGTDNRAGGKLGADAMAELVDAGRVAVTRENVAHARANFPEPVAPFEDPFAR